MTEIQYASALCEDSGCWAKQRFSVGVRHQHLTDARHPDEELAICARTIPSQGRKTLAIFLEQEARLHPNEPFIVSRPKPD